MEVRNRTDKHDFSRFSEGFSWMQTLLVTGWFYLLRWIIYEGMLIERLHNFHIFRQLGLDNTDRYRIATAYNTVPTRSWRNSSPFDAAVVFTKLPVNITESLLGTFFWLTDNTYFLCCGSGYGIRWLLDPGSGITKIRVPGSRINIPDPQYALSTNYTRRIFSQCCRSGIRFFFSTQDPE